MAGIDRGRAINLLFTITAYPPSIGGAQFYTHNIACNLAKIHTIQVVSHWDENRTDWLLGTTLRAPGVDRDYLQDGIPVHRLGLSVSEKLKILPFTLAYYPFMGVALPQLAKNLLRHLEPFASACDLVQNVRVGREPLSYASLYLARQRDIPFVFTPLHHPRWSGRLHRFYQQLYRQADALIALTEVERKILAGFGVDERKIFVTGNGPLLAPQADASRFRASYDLSDAPFILFLGQKYPYKGVEALLRSAPIVWRQVPGARFVFIGPRTPFSERLFAGVVDNRILEIGQVDLQTKTDALAACSLLCVPSTQESFGGVYTEAWSFGKPVIGCNIPAVAEVIAHGEDGFLTAQEPAAISGCILTLLQQSQTADQMGARGKLKVEERYNWTVVARKTEEVYKSVV